MPREITIHIGGSNVQVTIGRVVHYTLSEGDVAVINQRRTAVKAALQAGGEPSPYIGNSVEAGQTYPAIVVRVFDPNSTTANLQVQLDGSDTYWATSRREGEPGEVGAWIWPPRVS